MTRLVLVFLLLVSGLATDAEPSLQCRIHFVDDPPYEHSWLPWKDDHFRIAFDIQNKSDSAYAIFRSLPSHDGNPLIFLVETKTGKPAEKSAKLLCDYIFTDKSYLDLSPGKRYSRTIDFALYNDYKLDRGKTYSVWLIFRDYEPDYKFKDTTRTTPIWPHDIVSDTLMFER